MKKRDYIETFTDIAVLFFLACLIMSMFTACDATVNINNNGPQAQTSPATPQETPKTIKPQAQQAQSCPQLIKPSDSTDHTQGPTSYWECTNNCTTTQIHALYFSQRKINPSGYMGILGGEIQVIVETQAPLGVSGYNQKPYILNAVDGPQGLNPINPATGVMPMTDTSTSPSTTTILPAKLECDQLQLGDAIFSYNDNVSRQIPGF